jgi:hypothetical protein
MVVPILTYGSEVWITEFKPNFEALDKIQFEKTQNMILKNIQSPITAVILKRIQTALETSWRFRY